MYACRGRLLKPFDLLAGIGIIVFDII